MANSTPIYSKIADVQWANSATTANTTADLTSGTSYLVFSADSTNGGYLQKLRFRPKGTNVATVARVWLNNGSTTGTAANNVLLDELTLAASTASATSALSNYELPINFPLPPSYRVYVTLGTAVAAGYDITAVGGKY